MAKRAEDSNVFILSKQLREDLYNLMFNMSKANRVLFGSHILDNAEALLRNVCLAFNKTENKSYYLEEAISYFCVLRADIEFFHKNNMIHFEGKKNERTQMYSEQAEIYRKLGEIDLNLTRWLQSLKNQHS